MLPLCQHTALTGSFFPLHHTHLKTSPSPEEALWEKLQRLHLIDERGLLLQPPKELLPATIFSERSEQRLQLLLKRDLQLEDKFGNKGPVISLEDYLYCSIKHPKGLPIETFLRGSSAFYVIDIPAIFREILKDLGDFSEELKTIEENWLQMTMPSDFDILDRCAFDPELLNEAKTALAKLSGISFKEAHAFLRKFADGRNKLPLHGSPQEIYITSIGSSKLTADRVMGTPVPYLFKRDHLRIGIHGDKRVEPKPELLAQTLIQRELKIVLIEHHHTKNFLSALSALQLYSKGHTIIESTGTLLEAFALVQDPSTHDELIQSILSLIQSHTGDWSFFLMNVCHYLEKVLSPEDVEKVFKRIKEARAQTSSLIDLSKGTYLEIKEALYAVSKLCCFYEWSACIFLQGYQLQLMPPASHSSKVQVLQQELLPFKELQKKPEVVPEDDLHFKDPRLNLLVELARQKPLTPLTEECLEALEAYVTTEENLDPALAELLKPWLSLGKNWDMSSLCFALARAGYLEKAATWWCNLTTEWQRQQHAEKFTALMATSPRTAIVFFGQTHGNLNKSQLERLFQAIPSNKLPALIKTPFELRLYFALFVPSDPIQRLALIEQLFPQDLDLLEETFALLPPSAQPPRYLNHPALDLANKGYHNLAIAAWYNHTPETERKQQFKLFIERILASPRASLLLFSREQAALSNVEIEKLFKAILTHFNYSELLASIHTPLALKIFLLLLKEAKEFSGGLQNPLQATIDNLPPLSANMRNHLAALWAELFPHSPYLIRILSKDQEVQPEKLLLLLGKHAPKDMRLLEELFLTSPPSAACVQHLLTHSISPRTAASCWTIALERLTEMNPCPSKVVMSLLKCDHFLAEFNEEQQHLFQKLSAPKVIGQLLLSSDKKKPPKEPVEWLLKHDPEPQCSAPLLEHLTGQPHPMKEGLVQHYLPLLAKEEHAQSLRNLVEVSKDPDLLLFLIKQWNFHPGLSRVLSSVLIKLVMHCNLLEDATFVELLSSLTEILKKDDSQYEVYVLSHYMLLLKTKMTLDSYKKSLSIVMQHMHYFPIGINDPNRFEVYYTLLIFIENVAQHDPNWLLIPAFCLALMEHVDLLELSQPVNSPMPSLLYFFLENQYNKALKLRFPTLVSAALNTLLTLGQHYTFRHFSFHKRHRFLELLACINLSLPPYDVENRLKISELLDSLLEYHRADTIEEELQWIGCLHWGLGVKINPSMPENHKISALLYWLHVLVHSPMPACREEAKRLYRFERILIEKMKPSTIKELYALIFNG